METISTSTIQALETPPSSELAFAEGLVSNAALKALAMYSQSTGKVRAYQHPLRVVTILHDFVGEHATQGMFDAAALHDIAQRVAPGNPERDLALDTLNGYAQTIQNSEDNEHPNWEYTAPLLSDLDIIEFCSEHSRRTPAKSEHVARLLRSRENETVLSEDWRAPSGLVDPNRTDELLKNVSVAAAVIKAAEMLDNLQYPAPTDRSILQDVFDAEAFYAPLCEAIGYDGLSMALRGEAAVIRLNKRGDGSAVTKAQEILDTLGSHTQILDDVAGLFEHLVAGETIVETPITNLSGHNIILGNSVLHAREVNSGNPAWIHWRVKSLGSLAMKFAKHGEATRPADVLGTTILVTDVKELGVTFSGLALCIKANHVVEARNSPSRKQAYSIQGNQEYIDTVSAELEASGVISANEIQTVLKGNGHNVTKVTFVYLPHTVVDGHEQVEIPVEVQVQTVIDRQESVTGTANHIGYKAGKHADETVLPSIRARRDELNSGSLNPESIWRSQAFMRRIKLHI